MDKARKWYWKSATGVIRIYVSFGYSDSFITLQEAFEIARADYPEVEEKEFSVLEIFRSDRVKGYRCISCLIDREPNEDYIYDSAS